MAAVLIVACVIVLLYKQYHSKLKLRKAETGIIDEDFDNMMRDNEKFWRIQKAHIKLLEQIGQMYAVASNVMDCNGPQMAQVIALCQKDIALLSQYREALEKYSPNYDGALSEINYWESYKRLAIIYEKQGKLQKAIDVCWEAINNGITNDGNSSGFVGRAARLTRKLGNTRKKLV